MKIGLVLSQSPTYSETFFNSKIKGLKEYGYSIVLYVQENNSSYKNSEVVVAPKVSKNKCIQLLRSVFVLVSLLFYFKRISKFISLERKSGHSRFQIFKNCYTNSHILKADLDWLHFGFTTMAIQSEHVAKSINAKMAVSCRGYDMDVYPTKHPNCYDLVWKNVDKVHAISKYMLAKANSYGLSELTPSVIIYPAVNPNSFKSIIRGTLIKETPLQFTTIARLHWIKGLDYTLQALSILKQKGLKFTYQIIGNGPEHKTLQDTAHQLGLENVVSFRGAYSHEETLDTLNKTDIYIQYSLSEGFCNAVLEAQATGCLCVVSNGGALPENVLDEETGWVAPKQNPKALAETILRILDTDTNTLKAIRAKARNRVLEDFSIDKQIQSFIEFYE